MRLNGKRKENLIHIFAILGIFLISSYRIFEKPGLWFADEFGYAASAAYFAGMDWSEQISNISYYGLGYGILLIPAYKFCSSARQIMLYVDILNLILLVLSFELSVRFMKRFFADLDSLNIYIYAFFSILYINNLVQLQLAWPETLNLFLYWITLNLIMDVFIEKKVIYYALLSIFLCLCVIVHMRNIGIVVAAVIVLFIYLLKTKNVTIKQFMVFVLIALTGAVFFFVSKEKIQNILWDNSVSVAANDITSRIQSTRSLISFGGVVAFLKSIVCKYFYIVSSTYGVIVLGAIYGIKIVFQKEMDVAKRLIILYAILCFLCSFIIGNFAMMLPSRVDCVLYGRYFEPCLGLLLCMGVYSVSISDCMIVLKKYCIIIVSIALSSFIVHSMISSFDSTFAVYPCISGLGKYFSQGADLKMVTWQITAEIICKIFLTMGGFILCLQINILKTQKKFAAVLAFCLAIICMWVGDARTESDDMLKSEIERYSKIIPIVDKVFDYDITFESDKNIYYLMGEDEKWNEYLLGIQFMLGKNRLFNIPYTNWSDILESDPILIIMKNESSSNDVMIMDNFLNEETVYEPICATKEFVLYKSE